MADETDTLELDDTQALEPEAEQEEQDVAGDEGEDETVIAFGEPAEEGAAPAPESSVIRDLRRANRELARKLHEKERGQQPQRIEVGEKPTLAACDFDEDQFEAQLDDWKQRKAASDRIEAEQQERTKAEQEEWSKRAETYTADKAKLRVPDFASAEDEVFSALSAQHQALILMTDKPAALVYALSRNPAKLEELSKLDLARAAMLVGKLEDKVTVTTKRRLPQPDRPIRGDAPISMASTDKELARLEKEAERTGDRTALIAYRRTLRA
ncbi:hypothetical protein [Novosphingobium sp. MMS21-SN21R]|uniref:hypothetical protein n=1 Tax=Novosphingobium sp. MMS21-SN21R TaxID=2969298 RepID=UPI002885D31D|nr:hypothetical protein [Novosphingobium sp. MMS21-SN21R]MDT0507527.1 hypothetical protein [Novosphingobium sp. MMS21-SN21R]